jgi:transcriptional regulator with XRE-family HTH domain
LPRTIKPSERIKVQTISKILGVSCERAAHLCETGAFPSARRICNYYWIADKSDVLKYKRRADKKSKSKKEKKKRGEERKSVIGERLAPYLGKMSDAAVARLTGVSRPTVTRYRKKAGISSIKTLCKWEDFYALLGRIPDEEVAELAGRSLAAVCYWRKKFNIPTFDKWAKLDSLLRTMSDEEIAEKLECSPETVRKRRKLYKMPAPRKPVIRTGEARPRREIAEKKTNGEDLDLSRYHTLDTLIAMIENEKNQSDA